MIARIWLYYHGTDWTSTATPNLFSGNWIGLTSPRACLKKTLRRKFSTGTRSNSRDDLGSLFSVVKLWETRLYRFHLPWILQCSVGRDSIVGNAAFGLVHAKEVQKIRPLPEWVRVMSKGCEWFSSDSRPLVCMLNALESSIFLGKTSAEVDLVGIDICKLPSSLRGLMLWHVPIDKTCVQLFTPEN